MGTRRKARELAMQALFFMDMRKDFSEESFGRFYANFAPKADVRSFFLQLVRGVLGSRAELDELIERFSENWTLSRMSAVDRNVMRIAVYEMVCCRDIPAKVSINEAVDIGKKFGSEDSGAFINGIVDSIRAVLEEGELTLPCREPQVEDPPIVAKEPGAAKPPEPQLAEEPPKKRPGSPAAGRPRKRTIAASGSKPPVRRKRKKEPSQED